VELHLVDLQLDLTVREEIANLLGREVTNADVMRQSRADGGFHSLPGRLDWNLRRRLEIRSRTRENRARLEWNGPVDQVKIEVSEAEILECLLDRTCNVIATMGIAP
jgi:hypothetical protein